MEELKRRKLTLKTAKELAVLEIGTATGLRPNPYNNYQHQQYIMDLGNRNSILVVSNDCPYGFAYVSFCGERTYYNVDTLKVDWDITEKERKQAGDEKMIALVIHQGKRLMEELVLINGREECRKMLESCPEGTRPIFDYI